ncbi:hypothetical protein K505DRAFT_333808 [Melanomma pulvis-pyrius CBS 109.77]|uniref:Uncharacterized protein n=1 Tax=Melanomma pulvis-pyrius CBS 109.77 TaxID=1314802 RepID=A0A6A6XNF2_9PLEO|nr:hypothetical protein K505DRAFT_333808 [Melanomma pulvis-pyrius CBS 109.77]
MPSIQLHCDVLHQKSDLRQEPSQKLISIVSKRTGEQYEDVYYSVPPSEPEPRWTGSLNFGDLWGTGNTIVFISQRYKTKEEVQLDLANKVFNDVIVWQSELDRIIQRAARLWHNKSDFRVLIEKEGTGLGPFRADLFAKKELLATSGTKGSCIDAIKKLRDSIDSYMKKQHVDESDTESDT